MPIIPLAPQNTAVSSALDYTRQNLTTNNINITRIRQANSSDFQFQFYQNKTAIVKKTGAADMFQWSNEILTGLKNYASDLIHSLNPFASAEPTQTQKNETNHKARMDEIKARVQEERNNGSGIKDFESRFKQNTTQNRDSKSKAQVDNSKRLQRAPRHTELKSTAPSIESPLGLKQKTIKFEPGKITPVHRLNSPINDTSPLIETMGDLKKEVTSKRQCTISNVGDEKIVLQLKTDRYLSVKKDHPIPCPINTPPNATHNAIYWPSLNTFSAMKIETGTVNDVEFKLSDSLMVNKQTTRGTTSLLYVKNTNLDKTRVICSKNGCISLSAGGKIVLNQANEEITVSNKMPKRETDIEPDNKVGSLNAYSL